MVSSNEFTTRHHSLTTALQKGIALRHSQGFWQSVKCIEDNSNASTLEQLNRDGSMRL